MARKPAQQTPYRSANWIAERLYFDGDTYFDDILRAISLAEKTVDIEAYILDDDELGKRFEATLAQAAEKGIRVRLLVDGIGAATWAERKAKALEESGTKVRIYHPIKMANLIGRLLMDLGIRRHTAKKSKSVFAHLNRRDHRKMVIIDSKAAWIGSLNISAVHSERAVGTLAWRDTGARVEGDGVEDLLIGFEYAWVRSHNLNGVRQWTETLFPKKRRQQILSPLVRMNFTLPLRRRTFREFSTRLKYANDRIWITNAYLAPSAPILRRLKKAARRGVDVRILVPRKSDVFFMPWVAGSFYKELLASGVKIYEYLPRFLHAKSVIIDDWLVVGSSNMNRRSMLKDFEVDIVLKKTESIRSCLERFEKDLAESEKIKSAPGGLTARLGKLIISFAKNWI